MKINVHHYFHISRIKVSSQLSEGAAYNRDSYKSKKEVWLQVSEGVQPPTPRHLTPGHWGPLEKLMMGLRLLAFPS